MNRQKPNAKVKAPKQRPRISRIQALSSGTAPPEVLRRHFEASGLEVAHLKEMQVKLVPASGDRLIPLPVDCARIPYFDLDGQSTDFYRLRLLDDWMPDGDAKPRKYMQAANTGNHLYLPPLLDVPWRVVASDPTTEILITEGEKKAACACVHGLPTIGLGGVWNWRAAGAPIAELDWFNWRNRKVFIAFDSPDVRTNSNVSAALESLAAELRWRGAIVKIAVLPSPDNKKVGLDDFLVKSGKAAMVQLMESAPEHLDFISEFNEKLAVIWVGAKAYVLKESRRADGSIEVDFAKPADVKPGFADRFITITGPNGPRQVNLFDFWLRDPKHRRYERVVFEPGGCAPDEYNLWRGFSVLPQAGDCSLYLEHIRVVVCQSDPKLYAYVIGWMAHMIQRPGELSGTALVLRGKQGTGKGAFVHTLGALLQAHYLHLSSPRHLLGNFNAHTKDKLLFFADEAFWAGDKTAEGTLKALITEPKRMLEHKGRDALVINNYTRLIIASNHDWVVPAGMEERRFVMLDVSAAHMQDTAYFGKLAAQMNKAGLAALLHFLMQVDLSAFNPRLIPKTAALLETKLLSLPPVHRFWFECLWEGTNGGSVGVWESEVRCTSLYRVYSEHPSVHGQSRRAVQSELGKALKRLVPGLTDVRRRTSGTSSGANSQQERYWRFPSLAKCREAFCAELNQKVDWEATDTAPAPVKRTRKLSGSLGLLGGAGKYNNRAGASAQSRPSRPISKN